MEKAPVNSIHELLNEEKWTRAALNSYSINNFIELDKLIDNVRQNKLEVDVKEICEDHLKHSKNSIIALYISGIISLSRQLVDDSNLIMLINLFSDNHKWNIVEYLCNRILEFGENKYALRTLADCYDNENRPDKKYAIWERLIKVDYEETELVKQLAERSESEGNYDSAIEYYKKALNRFLNKKMFSNVKEIWGKLLEISPNDTDFYFRIEKKAAAVLNGDRAALLLNAFYHEIKNQEKWDVNIRILKKILEYEPKNQEIRNELIECFKNKYSDHSQLNEYIRISNLNQSWRNVHDAIADFEKHIAFDKNNFVFHRSWGIGIIHDIQRDTFKIDFAIKKNHKMSLKMAVNALKILGNDHIWVLKGTIDKTELKKKVKSDPAWALKTIIKSFDNEANMKKIKAELVPDILSASEWTKWNTEARKILKTDPVFGNLPDKRDLFEVRETPISFEEKAFNRFKAEKNFYGRVQTFQDFIKEVDPDSEYFEEMFYYFTGFCKSFTSVTDLVISSFLLIHKLTAMHPYLKPGFDCNFEELFERIEDLPEVFNKIENMELKKEFLIHIERNVNNWPEVYSNLFRFYPSKFIIEELISGRRLDIINDLFSFYLTHYKDFKEPFIWLVRNITEEPWFAGFSIPFEKILICMIHLLDITYREISNRKDVSLNRKLNKQILDYLFKENRLMNYLMISDEDSITRLYTLVEDVKELDPSLKIKLKVKIKERFPNYKFIGEAEIERKSRGKLITRAGYEAKQKSLRHILEVEVPQNSKDIGKALEKGDLRENAEYKAALEKQDILNSKAAKLQGELAEAQIFDESKVDTGTISFGTKIRLYNLKNQKSEEYTILGPWESEPSKNIISYLSPLGIHLCSRKLDDELKFKINEKEFHYKVESIEKAQIL